MWIGHVQQRDKVVLSPLCDGDSSGVFYPISGQSHHQGNLSLSCSGWTGPGEDSMSQVLLFVMSRHGGKCKGQSVALRSGGEVRRHRLMQDCLWTGWEPTQTQFWHVADL